LTERGRYRLGPLRIWTRFPLGLVRHTRWLDDKAEIVVCPRIGCLKAPTRQIEREALTSGTQARRRGVTEGEFHGLRDWRGGDSQRWIHWRTTARRGDLVVRQFEQEQHEDLTLLLELWRPERPTAEDNSRVELAIRYAATVLEDASRRGGARLTLRSTGSPAIDCRGQASSGLFAEMLRALAVVEPDSSDELTALVNRTVAEERSGARMLVITTRPPTSIEPWESPATSSRQIAGRVERVSVASDTFDALFDGS
jgi:uncharacterized protein (DUF58 family)